MVRLLDDDVAVGSEPAALDKISADDGGLGGSPQFGRAVPDSKQVGAVLFVDIARALELFGDGVEAQDRADLEVLEAVGATSTGGQNGTFRNPPHPEVSSASRSFVLPSSRSTAQPAHSGATRLPVPL